LSEAEIQRAIDESDRRKDELKAKKQKEWTD
jgi:hypothetical protein